MHVSVRSKRDDREEGGVLVSAPYQRLLVATSKAAFTIEETADGHLTIYVSGIDRLVVHPEGHSCVTLQSVSPQLRIADKALESLQNLNPQDAQ